MVAPKITGGFIRVGEVGPSVDIQDAAIERGRYEFSDDYEFVGSYVQRAGQLGNAVPPLLAQRITEGILASAIDCPAPCHAGNSFLPVQR